MGVSRSRRQSNRVFAVVVTGCGGCVDSLQAIEQSMARTQQLINRAQRLAYDINQIDQGFQRTYPQSYRTYPQSYAGSTTSQQLVSDAQSRAGRTRWPHTRTLSAFRLAYAGASRKISPPQGPLLCPCRGGGYLPAPRPTNRMGGPFLGRREAALMPRAPRVRRRATHSVVIHVCFKKNERAISMNCRSRSAGDNAL